MDTYMKTFQAGIQKAMRSIGEEPVNPDTSETPPSKTSNLQGESERLPHTLYFEINLANGETRPVRLQWGEGPTRCLWAATIYNNAGIMARIRTH